MAAENPAATDDELTLGFGCRSRFGDSGFRARVQENELRVQASAIKICASVRGSGSGL